MITLSLGADPVRLPSFVSADGSGPAPRSTTVDVSVVDAVLHAEFACVAGDFVTTYQHRDDPIYNEEVVEIFIGAGSETPSVYYEFELSPDGVLFDAEVTVLDKGLRIDVEWDCPGISWSASRGDGSWSGRLSIPLASVGGPADVWRGNFYRIDHGSRDATAYSCWSPTLTEPANFHVPSRFGLLHLR